MVRGATDLTAFDPAASPADVAARASFALTYCQQRNSSFGGVGVLRGGVLPAALAAQHAAAVQTYAPATGAVCAGAACRFIAVMECVPAGAAPCPTDANGNVG